MHRSGEGNQLILIRKCSSLLPTRSKVDIIKAVIHSDSNNSVENNQLSLHILGEGCTWQIQICQQGDKNVMNEEKQSNDNYRGWI